MSQVVYAIGDVHGRDALLGALHDHIADHHAFFHSGRPALIVHLGDYIDRGPESLAVIDRLRCCSAPFESICLLGNHEDMLLKCLATDDSDVWRNWVRSGGDATLASLGLSTESRNAAALRRQLGPDRIAWLQALPVTHQTPTHLFVHAGLRPGIPLSDQDRHDVLWIRTPFLKSDADHGRIVVHGHTPADDPVVRLNRIGLDVSARPDHRLAAVVLCPAQPPRFLFAYR